MADRVASVLADTTRQLKACEYLERARSLDPNRLVYLDGSVADPVSAFRHLYQRVVQVEGIDPAHL